MIGNKSLYPKIGQTIFNVSPDGAKTLIMRASLSDDGEDATFEFDWIDRHGKKDWFLGGAAINAQLRDLLQSLRQSYIDDGQEDWTKCEFVVDVETGKFEFNIDYEDDGSDEKEDIGHP